MTRHMAAAAARHQDWRQRAACLGADPGLFFPPEAGGDVQAAKGKAICAGCPVRAQCLAYAAARPEKYGIWGGVAERDRRQPRAVGASRFRGVTRIKRTGKWQARTVRDGRRVYLGVFAGEAEAGRAVLEAEGARPGTAGAPPSPQSRKAA